MSLKHRWSNSSLSLLQSCAEAWRRRYIEGERMPPRARMIRGTTVHKVASMAYGRKLETHMLPTVEEAQDLAATAFDASWKAGVDFSEEERAHGLGKVRAESKDFAIDLAGFHVTSVAPAIDPIGVERHIVVTPKDSDLEIHGYIDLIDRTPTGEQIRDLKTAERAPQSSQADTSQQLTFYGLIRLAETGALPERFKLDHLVRTPVTAKKSHVVQTTTRDTADIGALVHRLNTAVAGVERGIFIPADPGHWKCSKQWCEYWDTCPYTRRSDRPKN